MKVERVRTTRIHPQKRQTCQQTALLPVIDAWYAYRRTPTSIYLFDASPGHENLASELIESLSRTLNFFLHFAGTVKPYVYTDNDGKGQQLQRTQVIWGGDEPGVEFIEARTRARIQALLPPSAQNTSAYLWDCTASSLRPLFPDTAPATSGLRVQMTTFMCGGFSVGIDFDHGLADAHSIGLFIRYWSTIYDQLFPSKRHTGAATAAPLPDILFKPQFLNDSIPTIDSQQGPDPILLQKAADLPTRRPDFRSISETDTSKLTQNKVIVPSAAAPQERSPSVSCLLHIPSHEYSRITQTIQERASMRVTDQVALVSFLWAALNRARASTRYSVDLVLAASLRWKLGLPEGLLGCLGLAIMISSGSSKDGETCDPDPAKLADSITLTLNKYDEDALLAVIYDASLRDSPTGSFRPASSAEHMVFTPVAQFGTGNLSFGDNRLVFFAPTVLAENLFILVDGVDTTTASSGGVGEKWYRNGANVFFALPKDIFDRLVVDPVLERFEKRVDT